MLSYSSSGDDEFVDVREELDDEYDNDHYEVAVQDPDGGQYTGPSLTIRHKSSASSMGTTKSGATQNTQKGRIPVEVPSGSDLRGRFQRKPQGPTTYLRSRRVVDDFIQ